MNKLFPAAGMLIFFFLNLSNTFSQKTWTLRQCIEYAMQNNIQVKQNLLKLELAKTDLKQSMANVLPNLNGFASHEYNFGRTIDPFTNEFATNQVQSDKFYLSSSLVLFNGFQSKNTIQEQQLQYKAGGYDVQKMQNDIALNVANAYLNVLFSEELGDVARNQKAIVQQQFERTKKLVEAGMLAQGSLFEMQAQLALEDAQVVGAENQVDLAYLALVQLLELKDAKDFRVQKPELDIPAETLLKSNPEQIFEVAKGNLPEVKSAETKLQGSRKSLGIAKGTASPKLSLVGSIGTGYSGLSKQLAGTPTISGVDTIGFTGHSFEPVLAPTFYIPTETTPFSKQVDDNFNKSIGFNLSFPIFNGWQSRTAISKAKLNLQNAEYTLQLTKDELQRSIQKAYTDATSALKQYYASQKSAEAFKEAFNYADKKYKEGMITAVDFNDTKNKLMKAESDFLRAKYDYIFKAKVLDFYVGKPLGEL